MMPVITISEDTYRKLQDLAEPFVDNNPESVISRLAAWADEDPDVMRKLLTDDVLRQQVLAAIEDVMWVALIPRVGRHVIIRDECGMKGVHEAASQQERSSIRQSKG